MTNHLFGKKYLMKEFFWASPLKVCFCHLYYACIFLFDLFYYAFVMISYHWAFTTNYFRYVVYFFIFYYCVKHKFKKIKFSESCKKKIQKFMFFRCSFLRKFDSDLFLNFFSMILLKKNLSKQNRNKYKKSDF